MDDSRGERFEESTSAPHDRGSVSRRPKRTARLVALAVLALGGVAVQGCAELHEVATAMRSTSDFVPTNDPRVFAEPGAATLTAATTAAVPGAIRRVEGALGGPFTIPVRVYVCATIDTYERFTNSERSGGNTTIAKKIFISPKPENTPQRIPAVLAHELTHLHVAQRLGLWRMRGLPSWFSEGLAAFVSGGGGAEGVAEADAVRAIRAGHRLTPGYSRNQTASSFGLPAHLFYRQAAMFIGYLKDRDASAFGHFVASVEEGTAFQRSFEDAYRADVGTVWGVFVAQLTYDRVPPAGQ